MRINLMSPPRVTETLITHEMNSSINLPDATSTKVYLASIQVTTTGQSLISEAIGNHIRLRH